MSLQLVLVLALPVFVFVVRRLRDTSRSLPPGPKPLPLIGNILDLPRAKAWLGYHEMCKQYGKCSVFHMPQMKFSYCFAIFPIGDVMFLDIPLQPLLVVGSAQAAADLLEKRSHMYSDRLQLLMPKLCVIAIILSMCHKPF